MLKTIITERVSRLPEPSDAWIPRYTEFGEVTARVLPHAVAVSDISDISDISDRRIVLPAPRPAPVAAVA